MLLDEVFATIFDEGDDDDVISDDGGNDDGIGDRVMTDGDDVVSITVIGPTEHMR